ncbi:MAG: hypothetical protein DRP76_00230 [Candidatus Omnitrophota bacterium]|nr:MAG: hypothetical protein DRP76_00230 [Candidatus Omnitrophota bacterium]
MLQISFLGIAGILSFFAVFFRPTIFYPLLIFYSVFSGGLMINGHCISDEVLLGSIISGILLAKLVKKEVFVKEEGERIFSQMWRAVFLVMCLYMLVEVVRGGFVWQDWKLLRWFPYYLMLFFLPFILLDKRVSASVFQRRAVLLVAGGIFLYFSLYLLHGFFFEKVVGISRYSLKVQGVLWSGSAYAVFPVILGALTAIFLINSKLRWEKLLGWFLWVLVIIVSFYYDSRVGFWTIIVFIFVSWTVTSFRNTLVLFLCYLVVFSIYYGRQQNLKVKLEEHFTNIVTLGHSPAEKEEKEMIGNLPFLKRVKEEKNLYKLWFIDPLNFDLDRMLNIYGAFEAISKDWKVFLFGYGVYSSHYVMIPYLTRLYKDYLPRAKSPKKVWTMGFPALLVDTGIVGFLLLLAVYVMCGFYIVRSTPRGFKTPKYILLLALLLSFGWLFVTNILDFCLFYLLILPGGILTKLIPKCE